MVVKSQYCNETDRWFYALNDQVLECKRWKYVNNRLASLIKNSTTTLSLNGFKEIQIDQEKFHHSSFDNIVSLLILDSEEILVKPLGFFAFNHLKHLRLTGNIWHVPVNNSFLGLQHLQSLDLSSNQLQTLSADSFKGLTNLEVLELSSNDLTALPANVFRGLIHLERLSLRANNICTVQPDAFAGLEQLSYLDMANNGLKLIIADEINLLKNLEHLDLTGNRIASLSGPLSLPKLKFLFLVSNKLTTIPAHLFQQCKSTKLIDLSLNCLHQVSEDSFLNHPSLEYLNLSGNNVSTEGFTSLKLQTLVVSDH